MSGPLWTGADIALATGGRLSAPFEGTEVTFDSREVIGGELFVAMRGEQADGHAFVGQAAARGATGFLVGQPVPHPHVLVADPFQALQALGRAARARTAAKVIGVTGSVGKTGTKEALRQAFERMAPGRVHASVKSYNNHSGVPLSLARMPADTRYAILEMGMNHAGEIAALTEQVRPHVAAITWVAGVHLEHFPDGEAGVARAKAEIFAGVEQGGWAVFPADNRHAALLQGAADAHGLQTLSFGESAAADVRLLRVEVGALGSDLVADVAGEELHCRVGIPGRHWVSNALCLLGAVKAAGGDLAEAGLALAGLRPLAGRGERVAIPLPGGTATILDESYNANPTSMAVALAVLRDTPAKRRLAILGAMRELGEASDRLHADLADPIAEAKIAELALVGAEMQALALDGASHLADAKAALSWARANLRDGDVLLVKGSNSVGLGTLVEALKGALKGAGA